MGLIINKAADNISFPDLLDKLEIFPESELGVSAVEVFSEVPDLPINVGGPVETGRGFVLHTSDYFAEDSTMEIQNEICLTATLDILTALASGRGPQQALLALGYAGWSPGQLESEIQANGWLNCPADPGIIFSSDQPEKYERALATLGIDPSFLVSDAGHA